MKYSILYDIKPSSFWGFDAQATNRTAQNPTDMLAFVELLGYFGTGSRFITIPCQRDREAFLVALRPL